MPEKQYELIPAEAYVAWAIYADYDGEAPDSAAVILLASEELAKEVRQLIEDKYDICYVEGCEWAKSWQIYQTVGKRDAICCSLEQAIAQLGDPDKHMVVVHLLPNFYQTNFKDLPAPVTITPRDLAAWLRQDNAHGAIVSGQNNHVAIWTGDESGADDAYYTQNLSPDGTLEDPNDANWEGTAAQAIDSAVQSTL